MTQSFRQAGVPWTRERLREMQGKKVIIVANTAWYLYNFRSNLIQKLIDEGWNVVLIAPEDEYYSELAQIAGIEISRLKYLSRKGRNPFQDYRLYREMLSLYRAHKPDVVLQYTIKPNIYGSIAAARLQIPAISVVPGLGHAFLRPGPLRAIVSMLCKRAFRPNRFVVFENAEDMHELVQRRIVSTEQTRVFKGCGIDTAHFAPVVRSSNNSAVRFLFAGRLIKEKGIEEFVEAAHLVRERYPHTQFSIAGNIDTENPGGFTQEEFKEMISSDNIEYLGFVRDVREAIRKADCVVLPSYYPEGLPRVLLESMAMATPVISTNSRGCRDAIEDGQNGYLAKPRESTDLAAKMIAFCEDSPEERAAMGGHGRQKALKEYDDKHINAQYLGLLRACTA
jgi:glycosyltransferase involved in cell wall biosynthesis